LGEEEQAVKDPMMVLPRAWSSAVNVNLDEAVKISEQATKFAEQNYPAEADWYRMYCGGEISNNR
jgi:ATP/maltotriose-dependent transcriptional regulator MalT